VNSAYTIAAPLGLQIYLIKFWILSQSSDISTKLTKGKFHQGCHGGNKHFEILQYLGGKIQNVVDARSLSAYQAQIGRVFALHVVLTFSIDLSGVNSTKTEFIPLVLHPQFE
jgi:hypothetical protein